MRIILDVNRIEVNGLLTLIVDMIKDRVNLKRRAAPDIEAEKIIPRINKLATVFRRKSGPVIFACDSFMADDFIFGGRMKPHAIRGTPGDLPIEELDNESSDVIFATTRMSAFHKTTWTNP